MAGWVVFSALIEKAAESIRCPCGPEPSALQVKYKAILESDMGQIFVRPYRCVDYDCQVCGLPTDKRHPDVLKHSLASHLVARQLQPGAREQ
jgi:hypothetical protein